MARRTRDLSHTQNFIRDARLIEHLIERAGIDENDVVYEIGAGTGTITERLARRARRVIAIEQDPALCARLRTRFAHRTNVEIRCADFLAHPLPRRPYKVFSNPPFDITSAIVTKLLSAPVPPVETFMAVQTEAADRFRGRPRPTMHSVLFWPWFATDLVARIPRSAFMPAPGVDVVMVRWSKRDPPLLAPRDAGAYRDLVVACFSAWRPTLGAALGRALGGRVAEAIVRAAHVDGKARPRDVAFDEWLRVFQVARVLRAPLHRVSGAAARLRRQQARLERPHRTRVTGPPLSVRAQASHERAITRPPVDVSHAILHAGERSPSRTAVGCAPS